MTRLAKKKATSKLLTPQPGVHWTDAYAATPWGHHSDQTFQDCPRKYYYTYERGLRALPSVPLLVGSTLHAALAVYHGMAEPIGKEKAGEKAFSRRTIAAFDEAQSYLTQHGAHLIEEERIDADVQVFRTLRHYVETYPIDPWETIAVEHAFDLELFPGIRSTGRFDGIIRQYDQLLVLEHKTTSFPCQKFFEQFSVDTQVTRYCRAASLLLGEPVHGVLLNVIQKPPKSGVGKAKFDRYVVVRTQAQIDDLERDLLMTRAFRESARGNYCFPKNTHSCHDYFRKCEFFELCHGTGETEENLSQFERNA